MRFRRPFQSSGQFNLDNQNHQQHYNTLVNERSDYSERLDNIGIDITPDQNRSSDIEIFENNTIFNLRSESDVYNNDEIDEEDAMDEVSDYNEEEEESYIESETESDFSESENDASNDMFNDTSEFSRSHNTISSLRRTRSNNFSENANNSDTDVYDSTPLKRRRLNRFGSYKYGSNGVKYKTPNKIIKCKQSKRIRALAYNPKRNEIAAISMNAAFHYFDVKRFEQVNLIYYFLFKYILCDVNYLRLPS